MRMRTYNKDEELQDRVPAHLGRIQDPYAAPPEAAPLCLHQWSSHRAQGCRSSNIPLFLHIQLSQPLSWTLHPKTPTSLSAQPLSCVSLSQGALLFTLLCLRCFLPSGETLLPAQGWLPIRVTLQRSPVLFGRAALLGEQQVSSARCSPATFSKSVSERCILGKIPV